MNAIEPTRRGFLIASASAAGGLVVALKFGVGPGASAAEGSVQLGALVRIEPDGRIILGAPKPDIGQGVNTSMPMLLAEELDVSLDGVEVEQLPVSMIRRENGSLGWGHVSQAVGGSTAVPSAFEPVRRMGAEARRRLVQAAANRWGVDPGSLRTEAGQVIGADGQSLAYGEIAGEAAALSDFADEAPLKSPEDFRVIGHDQKMVHVDRIVTGTLEYGIDAEMDGMLHAVVAHAPRLGAKLIDFDGADALAVDGVRHVVAVPGPEPMGSLSRKPIADGVAIVADSHWAALKGQAALKARWTDGAMAGVGSADLARRIDEMMQQEGQVIRDDGDAAGALGGAVDLVEATYDLPFVSHATLEPQGCTAHVRENGCELVIPTQDPADSIIFTAEWLGIDPLDVKTRFTRIGGGFGRRLDVDYVLEAVEISRQVGRPVHLLWPREEDMRNDYYRPLVRHHIRAGLDGDGNLAAWHARLASTGRYFRRGRPREEFYIPEYWLDDFPAGLTDNLKVEYFFLETAVPTGPWRAPGHTANAFVVQSFLDELAHARGEDPLELRLRLLGQGAELPYGQHGGPIFDTARLKHVLEDAAERAGWSEDLGPRRGRGIAGHFTFGGYAAHVIDVAVSEAGELSIDRVVSSVDVGIPVNPNGIRAQAEGSINDGISTALGQQITLADGAVVEGNFDRYRMMRIGGSPPEIDVHVVRSTKPPSGMGEIAIPPAAPALTNAIFAATGKRIRRLPIGEQLRA